jgi:vacuolar-type H+-ATPase subunit I/STV1
MSKKDQFSLIKVEINENYKDQFLIELSNMNIAHLKPREEPKLKSQIEEKDPIYQKIKALRKSLNSLYNRLEITAWDLANLKVQKEKRVVFEATDLLELINHLVEEIDFYANRIIELKRYISQGIIELDKLREIQISYRVLQKLDLNVEKIYSLNQFKLRVFTTFTKNLFNLQNLFDTSEFPNFYDTFELTSDRIGFYILYPHGLENEFNARIRIIHSEEVPILKKYFTSEGINFQRIDKELNFIENLVSRYRKEQTRIVQDNLIKLAGIGEIVQNIEEYNWAERQFEKSSLDRLILKFFVPRPLKEETIQTLFQIFKDNITIESIDISKKHSMKETFSSKTKRAKDSKKSTKLEPLEIQDEVLEDESDDLREITPTVMRNFFIVRPFETITKLYGTPTYYEIDPTPIIAFTFPLLFGLMFGDIGHGIVLIISGLLGALVYRKRKGDILRLSWIIFFCGWAAFFVGFLYGEFLGHHEIEIFGNVLWDFEKNPIILPIIGSLNDPLRNILDVFYFAIIIGVFQINLGWFIQFLNYWKQKRKFLALSDSFVKILLLTGGAILLFNWGFDINSWIGPPYPILLVIIPGILLLLLKPLGKLFKISYLQEESFGGLLGEGSVEAFDTVLSVISNVASYIRLLALALAHIALLFAINAMAELIEGDSIGVEIVNIIGLTFGNIIVILLEGILVFINSLRLTFYEFFFKFYQGSGIEYFPFYLDNDYSVMKFSGEAKRDVIYEEIEREIDTKTVKEELEKAINYISRKFD